MPPASRGYYIDVDAETDADSPVTTPAPLVTDKIKEMTPEETKPEKRKAAGKRKKADKVAQAASTNESSAGITLGLDVATLEEAPLEGLAIQDNAGSYLEHLERKRSTALRPSSDSSSPASPVVAGKTVGTRGRPRKTPQVVTAPLLVLPEMPSSAHDEGLSFDELLAASRLRPSLKPAVDIEMKPSSEQLGEATVVVCRPTVSLEEHRTMGNSISVTSIRSDQKLAVLETTEGGTPEVLASSISARPTVKLAPSTVKRTSKTTKGQPPKTMDTQAPLNNFLPAFDRPAEATVSAAVLQPRDDNNSKASFSPQAPILTFLVNIGLPGYAGTLIARGGRGAPTSCAPTTLPTDAITTVEELKATIMYLATQELMRSALGSPSPAATSEAPGLALTSPSPCSISGPPQASQVVAHRSQLWAIHLASVSQVLNNTKSGAHFVIGGLSSTRGRGRGRGAYLAGVTVGTNAFEPSTSDEKSSNASEATEQTVRLVLGGGGDGGNIRPSHADRQGLPATITDKDMAAICSVPPAHAKVVMKALKPIALPPDLVALLAAGQDMSNASVQRVALDTFDNMSVPPGIGVVDADISILNQGFSSHRTDKDNDNDDILGDELPIADFEDFFLTQNDEPATFDSGEVGLVVRSEEPSVFECTASGGVPSVAAYFSTRYGEVLRSYDTEEQRLRKAFLASIAKAARRYEAHVGTLKQLQQNRMDGVVRQFAAAERKANSEAATLLQRERNEDSNVEQIETLTRMLSLGTPEAKINSIRAERRSQESHTDIHIAVRHRHHRRCDNLHDPHVFADHETAKGRQVEVAFAAPIVSVSFEEIDDKEAETETTESGGYANECLAPTSQILVLPTAVPSAGGVLPYCPPPPGWISTSPSIVRGTPPKRTFLRFHSGVAEKVVTGEAAADTSCTPPSREAGEMDQSTDNLTPNGQRPSREVGVVAHLDNLTPNGQCRDSENIDNGIHGLVVTPRPEGSSSSNKFVLCQGSDDKSTPPSRVFVSSQPEPSPIVSKVGGCNEAGSRQPPNAYVKSLKLSPSRSPLLRHQQQPLVTPPRSLNSSPASSSPPQQKDPAPLHQALSNSSSLSSFAVIASVDSSSVVERTGDATDVNVNVEGTLVATRGGSAEVTIHPSEPKSLTATPSRQPLNQQPSLVSQNTIDSIFSKYSTPLISQAARATENEVGLGESDRTATPPLTQLRERFGSTADVRQQPSSEGRRIEAILTISTDETDSAPRSSQQEQQLVSLSQMAVEYSLSHCDTTELSAAGNDADRQAFIGEDQWSGFGLEGLAGYSNSSRLGEERDDGDRDIPLLLEEDDGSLLPFAALEESVGRPTAAFADGGRVLHPPPPLLAASSVSLPPPTSVSTIVSEAKPSHQSLREALTKHTRLLTTGAMVKATATNAHPSGGPNLVRPPVGSTSAPPLVHELIPSAEAVDRLSDEELVGYCTQFGLRAFPQILPTALAPSVPKRRITAVTDSEERSGGLSSDTFPAQFAPNSNTIVAIDGLNESSIASVAIPYSQISIGSFACSESRELSDDSATSDGEPDLFERYEDPPASNRNREDTIGALRSKRSSGKKRGRDCSDEEGDSKYIIIVSDSEEEGEEPVAERFGMEPRLLQGGLGRNDGVVSCQLHPSVAFTYRWQMRQQLKYVVVRSLFTHVVAPFTLSRAASYGPTQFIPPEFTKPTTSAPSSAATVSATVTSSSGSASWSRSGFLSVATSATSTSAVLSALSSILPSSAAASATGTSPSLLSSSVATAASSAARVQTPRPPSVSGVPPTSRSVKFGNTIDGNSSGSLPQSPQILVPRSDFSLAPHPDKMLYQRHIESLTQRLKQIPTAYRPQLRKTIKGEEQAEEMRNFIATVAMDGFRVIEATNRPPHLQRRNVRSDLVGPTSSGKVDATDDEAFLATKAAKEFFFFDELDNDANDESDDADYNEGFDHSNSSSFHQRPVVLRPTRTEEFVGDMRPKLSVFESALLREALSPDMLMFILSRERDYATSIEGLQNGGQSSSEAAPPPPKSSSKSKVPVPNKPLQTPIPPSRIDALIGGSGLPIAAGSTAVAAANHIISAPVRAIFKSIGGKRQREGFTTVASAATSSSSAIHSPTSIRPLTAMRQQVSVIDGSAMLMEVSRQQQMRLDQRNQLVPGAGLNATDSMEDLHSVSNTSMPAHQQVLSQEVELGAATSASRKAVNKANFFKNRWMNRRYGGGAYGGSGGARQ